MGRLIYVKGKEHNVDIIHDWVPSLALVKHSDKTKNHICIEDIEILAKVEHFLKNIRK
jgi:hypothetical protein